MKNRVHSQLVREEVFFFGGYDKDFNETVVSLLDHNSYTLIDGALYLSSESGQHDIPMDTTTKRFNDGYYIGAGCLGNGVCYWNKREFENGDYKTFGQITQDGELIVKTSEKVLIDFLNQTHAFRTGEVA